MQSETPYRVTFATGDPDDVDTVSAPDPTEAIRIAVANYAKVTANETLASKAYTSLWRNGKLDLGALRHLRTHSTITIKVEPQGDEYFRFADDSAFVYRPSKVTAELLAPYDCEE